MKRFIHKTAFFALLPMLFFGANMLINYFNYTGQSTPIDIPRVLIAGDSHPQKSLNPALFSDARNISQSAEPYVLTFWKLKNLFKANAPDTLIIGFSPHNISQFNDLKFSERKWSSELFRRSYPIQEFRRISTQIPIDYTTYYRVCLLYTSPSPRDA